MVTEQPTFPLRLTEAQRRFIAELVPHLTARLDLERANQRTPRLTLQELKEIARSCRTVVPRTLTGMERNSLGHVTDAVEGILLASEFYNDPEPVNLGTGKDCTIRELALLIKEQVGYEGDIEFDPAKPDGTPRKVLDVSRLKALGWQAKISLSRGIEDTYDWFVGNRLIGDGHRRL